MPNNEKNKMSFKPGKTKTRLTLLRGARHAVNRMYVSSVRSDRLKNAKAVNTAQNDATEDMENAAGTAVVFTAKTTIGFGRGMLSIARNAVNGRKEAREGKGNDVPDTPDVGSIAVPDGSVSHDIQDQHLPSLSGFINQAGNVQNNEQNHQIPVGEVQKSTARIALSSANEPSSDRIKMNPESRDKLTLVRDRDSVYELLPQDMERLHLPFARMPDERQPNADGHIIIETENRNIAQKSGKTETQFNPTPRELPLSQSTQSGPLGISQPAEHRPIERLHLSDSTCGIVTHEGDNAALLLDSRQPDNALQLNFRQAGNAISVKHDRIDLPDTGESLEGDIQRLDYGKPINSSDLAPSPDEKSAVISNGNTVQGRDKTDIQFNGDLGEFRPDDSTPSSLLGVSEKPAEHRPIERLHLSDSIRGIVNQEKDSTALLLGSGQPKDVPRLSFRQSGDAVSAKHSKHDISNTGKSMKRINQRFNRGKSAHSANSVSIPARKSAAVVERVRGAVNNLVKKIPASSVIISTAFCLILSAMMIFGANAAVVSSPFGVFYSDQDNSSKTIPISSIIAQINSEYNARIEWIKSFVDHDCLEIHGRAIDYIDVIAVFAVRTTMREDDAAADVVTIDAVRAALMKEVFWDMVEISYTVEIHEFEETDDDDNVIEWTERTLHIYINSKTYTDMCRTSTVLPPPRQKPWRV